ncbi:MAG TPA: hypothetical protein VMN36_12715 [Verrucomicrobiales bacterium]|nr:hypothetical protein [Verrucomicrobiales bacterium]
MNHPLRRSLFALLGIAACCAAAGQEPKTRVELVREDQAAFETSAQWIYNNLEEGTAAARSSGKPLLVVHRCVP